MSGNKEAESVKEEVEEDTQSLPKELQQPTEEAKTIKAQTPPPKPEAHPIAAFRWREIDAKGNKVLEQAFRVEQMGKVMGVMWQELETIPFGVVQDPTI